MLCSKYIKVYLPWQKGTKNKALIFFKIVSLIQASCSLVKVPLKFMVLICPTIILLMSSLSLNLTNEINFLLRKQKKVTQILFW